MSGADTAAGGISLPPPARVRPGPDAIDAGTAPGGVVLHAYDPRTRRLLLERKLTPDTPAADRDAQAEVDADNVAARMRWRGDVCLVVFDGDTGARMTLPWPTLDDAARAFEDGRR